MSDTNRFCDGMPRRDMLRVGTAGLFGMGLPLAEILPGGLGPLVLALAAVVGFSRCYLGIHYPCDVFAGWMLALAAHIFDVTALP